MKFIIPEHPVRQPGEPWTAGQIAAEMIWQDWDDQPAQIVSERRLVALEEALISRKARRRLRRELRESAARFAWASDSFRGCRIEAVGNLILCWRDRPGAAA